MPTSTPQPALRPSSSSSTSNGPPLNWRQRGATYRATRHVIEYELAEPIHAKGKADPVPVWQPITPLARTGLALAEAARQPLVSCSGLFHRKVIGHQGKSVDFRLYFANPIKVGLRQFNRGNFALAQ